MWFVSCVVVRVIVIFVKLSIKLKRMSLLELFSDECDNLNFMNFKIDSFKIRKNSRILGTFNIRKI